MRALVEEAGDLAKMCTIPDLVRRLWNWAEHGVPEFCRTCSFHLPLGHVAQRPRVMEDPFAAMGG